jgi:hypothetical protein
VPGSDCNSKAEYGCSAVAAEDRWAVQDPAARAGADVSSGVTPHSSPALLLLAVRGPVLASAQVAGRLRLRTLLDAFTPDECVNYLANRGPERLFTNSTFAFRRLLRMPERL